MNIRKKVEKRDVKGLIKALSSDKDFIRGEAAKGLGTIKDPRALDALIKALGDEAPRVREAAAVALGDLKDARAVEPMIDLLADPDGNVRGAAIRALGETGDSRIIEPLIKLVGDDQFAVSSAARETLLRLLREVSHKVNDPRTAEPFIKALRNSDRKVRSLAAYALGELKDPRAMAALRQALGDRDIDVASEAAKAILKLDDPNHIMPLIHALEDTEHRVNAEMSRLWFENPLDGMSRSEAREKVEKECLDAIRLLCERKDPLAVVPLIKALGDKGNKVREAAAKALGELKDARAVDPLINVLLDRDNSVRLAAVKALELLGESQWGNVVKGKTFADDITFLCDWICKKCDCRIAGALARHLFDFEWGIRKKAAVTLLLISKAKPELNLLSQGIMDKMAEAHQDRVDNPSDCGGIHIDKGGIGVSLDNLGEYRESI